MTFTEPIAPFRPFADEHTPSAAPCYLADRLPFTLEAISKWPDYNRVMQQLGQTLGAASIGLGWTVAEIRAARMRKLLELYQRHGCFRFADPQKWCWLVRIVRPRPAKSFSGDAIGIGGPVSRLFRAFPEDISAGRSSSERDSADCAARFFDLLATTLATSARPPRKVLSFPRVQIAGAPPVTRKVIADALDIIRGFRVFKMVLSSRIDVPRVRELSDAVREVFLRDNDIGLRLHPTFTRFFMAEHLKE